MNPRPIARGRVRYASWHWTPAGEAWLSGAERQMSVVLPDGTWRQHTEVAPRRQPLPRFGIEQKGWLRFALERRPHDLQLRYQRRVLHLWGPPQRLLAMPPEWSLSVTIPSLAAGQTLLSLTYATPRMPSTLLRTRLRRLADMPALQPEKPNEEPVFFHGDWLLYFLKPSLSQWKQQRSSAGMWRADGPRLQPFNPREPLGEAGDADGADPNLAPSVPTRLRFFPNKIDQLPHTPWQALWYDADRRWLVCCAGNRYRSLRLKKPLYRYLKHMRFGRNGQTLVFNEVPHYMPDAMCYLNP